MITVRIPTKEQPMSYVVVNQHQDVQIAGACTVAGYQRRGYWIAFIGTWSECRDFVRDES